MTFLRKRSVKIIGWLLVIALSLGAMYVFVGMPNLTPTMAFRRMERSNLMGPGEILAHGEIENEYNRSFIVAKTEYNYELYVYERDFWWESRGVIEAFAITGGLQLHSSYWTGPILGGCSLTVFLFGGDHRAEQAEVIWCYDDVTYTARAQRQYEEFFLLEFWAGNKAEEEDLDELWHAARYAGLGDSALTTEVTVRLYDADGELLTEELVTVGNIQPQ